MGIQSIGGYTATSAIEQLRRQQNKTAGPTETSAASTAGNTDKVTFSRAALDRAAEQNKQGGAYDFTNMTPDQMVDVAQELNDSGKIDNLQHMMLLSTCFVYGRMGEDGQHIPPTEEELARHGNTPVNYVQYCKDRVSFLESMGMTTDPQYDGWKDLLATMQGMSSGSIA